MKLLFFRLIFCRFIPSPHPSRFVSTRSHHHRFIVTRKTQETVGLPFGLVPNTQSVAQNLWVGPTKAGRYGNPETGNVLNSGFFSEHWSRKWVATCHFFQPFSGFRRTRALWS